MRVFRAVTTGAVAAFCFVGATLAGGTDLLVLNGKSSDKKAKGGSVAFLDPDTFEIRKSVNVGREPSGVSLDPAGKLAYVVNWGKHDRDGDAEEPGSVSTIDLATRTVVADTAVGKDPVLFPLTTGAPVVCLSRDEDDKGVLSIFDPVTGRLRSTVSTGPETFRALASKDGRLVFVMRGDQQDLDEGGTSQLTAVDVVEAKVVLDEELPRRPIAMALSADGVNLYVVGGGRIDEDDRAKNEAGTLYVFATDPPRLEATVDIGPDPRLVQLDEARDQLYIAFATEEGRTGTKTGQLGVVKGRKLAAQIPIACVPSRIQGVDNRLFALCARTVSVVGLDEMRELRAIEVPFTVGSLEVRAGSQKGYVGESSGSSVAMLDLEAGRMVAKRTIGRTGMKVAMFAASVVVSAVFSAALGSSLYQVPIFITGQWPSASIVLEEDGSHLFAVNAETHDVTVIGAEDFKILDMVGLPEGARELFRTPSGQRFLAPGAAGFAVFDGPTNAVLKNHPLEVRGPFRFDGARRRAFAFTADSLLVIDLRTGEIPRKLQPLPSPIAISWPDSYLQVGESQQAYQGQLDLAVKSRLAGNVAEAEALYRKARELDPLGREAVVDLVALYKASGRKAEAAAEYVSWAQTPPSDGRRCWEAAMFKMYDASIVDASLVPLLECALTAGPDSGIGEALVLHDLARAYLESGDTVKARQKAEQAVKLGYPRAELPAKEDRRGGEEEVGAPSLVIGPAAPA